MSEEKTTITSEEVNFAVIIYETKDGNIGLQTVDDLPEMTNLDSLYKVVCILKRNFEAQHAAQVQLQTMAQLQTQVQAQQDGRTESGLIVPR